jgi:hypothetical protein
MGATVLLIHVRSLLSWGMLMWCRLLFEQRRRLLTRKSTYLEQLPTVLAKILGFYRIGYKNEHLGGKSMKIDVIVMENLFHERKISKVCGIRTRLLIPAE